MTSTQLNNNDSVNESKAHLLIVDDEDINRELFKRIFEFEHRLTLVASGEDALLALDRGDYDAVLLDVMLPGMTGFDVLRMIREQDNTADLPVIMISARSHETDVLHALRLGANDYISKPFSVEVARARVRTHVDLKRMNDKRRQMLAELQTTKHIQENFYRIVSHDLKGPLTNIRLAQSVLRDMVAHNPEANEILDNVEVTVQDMQAMILMFLDASALHTGKLVVDPVCVDVRDVLKSAVERVAFVAEKKQITLKFDAIDGFAFAYADPRLLAQILNNLVSNALKFSDPHKTVYLTAYPEGENIVFTVTDEGPGVPPEERPHLFEMFRQLSTSAASSDSGHGLGLWIVRQLVELMSGSVGYQPAPTGGSTFYVMLPACTLSDDDP